MLLFLHLTNFQITFRSPSSPEPSPLKSNFGSDSDEWSKKTEPKTKSKKKSPAKKEPKTKKTATTYKKSPGNLGILVLM